MTKPIQSAGEAMRPSLSKAIYQYRSDWFGYMAATHDDDDAPMNYKPALKVLEDWSTPAGDRAEAEDALQLAIEFYELGRSDVIPSMMSAALGWIKGEARRASSDDFNGGAN